MSNLPRINILSLNGGKIGGTEFAVESLFRAFVAYGWAARRFFAVKYEETAVVGNWLGLATVRGLGYFSYLNALRRIVKGCDIFIGTDIATNCLLIFVNLFFNRGQATIVAWEHYPFDRNSRYWLCVAKIFYRFLDGVVSLSDIEAEKLRGVSSKVVVIKNFVPMSPASSQVQDRGVDCLRLYSVGRISPEKGYERLINGLISARRLLVGSDLLLDIFGDGPEKGTLEQKFGQVGGIEFKGAVPSSSIKHHDYDVYVSGSYYECCPLSVIEAMMNGLPVISFDHQTGTSTIITNRVHGFLVQDGIGFSRAIRSIVEGEYSLEELGANAREYALANHSESSVLNHWRSFIDGLLVR